MNLCNNDDNGNNFLPLIFGAVAFAGVGFLVYKALNSR